MARPGFAAAQCRPSLLLVAAMLSACGGANTHFTFDVPQGVTSFTLVVQGSATFVGFSQLTSPSGDVVLQGPVTGPSNAKVGVLTWPGPVAGPWAARLVALEGSKGSTQEVRDDTLHAQAFLQTAATGGLLDLDVYAPEGLQLYGSTLEDRLQHAFGLIDRLYNVHRGEVREHTVAAELVSLVGQGQVDQANRAAVAGTSRPSAQVVLTNRLDPDGTGGSLSGLSNCLPGAPGVNGTVCSAVVVALRENTPTWLDGAVIAHELSHFAGLKHTTELDGTDDGLPDTPHSTDTSKSALASCPDHDNLMFPSANSATDEASLSVSPTQRATFRASALFHP